MSILFHLYSLIVYQRVTAPFPYFRLRHMVFFHFSLPGSSSCNFHQIEPVSKNVKLFQHCNYFFSRDIAIFPYFFVVAKIT